MILCVKLDRSSLAESFVPTSFGTQDTLLEADLLIAAENNIQTKVAISLTLPVSLKKKSM
ncbi:hypothetical protein [Falsiporphyromonas endometrii]|uniref:Uncharacterized protein n=1 Tax=Falsiporphyromonas endometrii TaxID=1387297 RepID=A0ABV9K7W0_9PORP